MSRVPRQAVVNFPVMSQTKAERIAEEARKAGAHARVVRRRRDSETPFGVEIICYVSDQLQQVAAAIAWIDDDWGNV